MKKIKKNDVIILFVGGFNINASYEFSVKVNASTFIWFKDSVNQSFALLSTDKRIKKYKFID